MRPVPFAVFMLCLAAFVLLGCTQQRSLEVCEKKPVEYGQRDQCFRYLAKDTNDTKYCGYINDSILRDYWCYREIAYCMKNSALCEQIEDQDAKASCYAVVSGTKRFEGGRAEPCKQ